MSIGNSTVLNFSASLDCIFSNIDAGTILSSSSEIYNCEFNDLELPSGRGINDYSSYYTNLSFLNNNNSILIKDFQLVVDSTFTMHNGNLGGGKYDNCIFDSNLDIYFDNRATITNSVLSNNGSYEIFRTSSCYITNSVFFNNDSRFGYATYYDCIISNNFSSAYTEDSFIKKFVFVLFN